MTTNDRELLELAAKAAGIFEQGEWFDNYDVDNVVSQSFIVGNYDWSPLTDDGDALRLAVKLGLYLTFQDNRSAVALNSKNGVGCIEHMRDDPYAATRRAIVRAAAAIGETK